MSESGPPKPRRPPHDYAEWRCDNSGRCRSGEGVASFSRAQPISFSGSVRRRTPAVKAVTAEAGTTADVAAVRLNELLDEVTCSRCHRRLRLTSAQWCLAVLGFRCGDCSVLQMEHKQELVAAGNVERRVPHAEAVVLQGVCHCALRAGEKRITGVGPGAAPPGGQA